MEKSNKTRIGLIGTGNICRVGHGPAIMADGRAYIAAISDPDPHNRDLFAKKYRVSKKNVQSATNSRNKARLLNEKFKVVS